MISNHIQQRVAEYGATASVSSAVVSFTAKTMPVLQWLAAAGAVLSALLASAWVIYKFYRELKGKPVGTKDES